MPLERQGDQSIVRLQVPHLLNRGAADCGRRARLQHDQVALERYKVSQNRYLIGKIDITNLNIALNEKDNAKRSYIQALNSFWGAYYDLRKLTLYDFADRKFLYDPFAKENQ